MEARIRRFLLAGNELELGMKIWCISHKKEYARLVAEVQEMKLYKYLSPNAKLEQHIWVKGGACVIKVKANPFTEQYEIVVNQLRNNTNRVVSTAVVGKYPYNVPQIAVLKFNACIRLLEQQNLVAKEG